MRKSHRTSTATRHPKDNKNKAASHPPPQDYRKTRKGTKQCTPKQRPNTEPLQIMGGTHNNKSTTTEQPPQKGHQPKPPGGGGGGSNASHRTNTPAETLLLPIHKKCWGHTEASQPIQRTTQRNNQIKLTNNEETNNRAHDPLIEHCN